MALKPVAKAILFLSILILVGAILHPLKSLQEGFQSKTLVVVFIAHKKEDAEKCLKAYPSSYILFVGPGEPPADSSRVIVARTLPQNIEHEKKLLTFTAWYAITKNRLFADADYIALFEYDVEFTPTFFQELQALCDSGTYDCITFNDIGGYFLHDVRKELMEEFVKRKNLPVPTFTETYRWYSTTNQCIRRAMLDEFVDWYYPECMVLKTKDLKKFSWYHERLFTVFLNLQEKSVKYLEGMKHLLQNSHSDMNTA